MPNISDCYEMRAALDSGHVELSAVMRAEFITVAPEDTLGEVAERMVAVNIGAVVVKDFGRLIGILTERDMLRAMAARVHTSDARVRQWMTEDPITASPEMPVRRPRRSCSTTASDTCPWSRGKPSSASSACARRSARASARPTRPRRSHRPRRVVDWPR